MPSLFDPLTLGAIDMPNRVVLAPLTRCRASEGRVPNDLMREYYTQRASAGLILTEATSVTPMGVGYIDTPGVWSDEQVDGWKRIVESVHDAGGRIVLQLWHVGRISHPDFLNGELPVSASAIAPLGQVRTPDGHKPYVTPRALTTQEVYEGIALYKTGAENAKRAGFDGVEVHGANGYLPDQFLRDGTNTRTDEFGGSIENRARFLLAVTDAAIEVWGADRVGVHLSPRNMDGSGAIDSDPASVFGYVSRELGKRKIAFIFSREGIHQTPRFTPLMKEAFGGPVIANEQFTLGDAHTVLDRNEADAVSWGRQFIANPDLPRRFALNAELNVPDPSTFYVPGAHGYTDYPFLPESA